MSAEVLRFDLVDSVFFRAWALHEIPGDPDPRELVERILALPAEKTRIGTLPRSMLLMTTIEAVVDGRKWCLIGHWTTSDRLSVFELQPRGEAGEEV